LAEKLPDEIAGWNVFHTGTPFQILDPEFHFCMLTVEGIERDGITFKIAKKPEVSPVRKEGGLLPEDFRTPHDEAMSLVDTLCNLCLAAQYNL